MRYIVKVKAFKSFTSFLQEYFCKIVTSSTSLYRRHLNPHDFTIFTKGNISLNFAYHEIRRTDLSLVFNFKNTHLVLRVFIFHFDLDKAGKEYFCVLTELDFVSNLYVRISIYVWKEKREKRMFSLRYKKTLIKKLKEQNFVFVVKKKNVLCVEILRLKTEKNQMNMERN